ncbi:hypothetical protein [Nannocystis radixulma]|uniref:Uncharacterized protein n=1 Tax=Nannocystis radixulma TaxID=2995305 RepID=A0ABT5BS15_9BACT|nr:hypothetical protein [Nannocystis radixulma]MDC0675711.1 hypothetical protein [Nannocystis radixulma]
MSRPRPASVPETAIFDDTDQLWELGERDAESRKVGAWTYWRPDGSKECEEAWGDGRTYMSYRRFHPDGSVAQSSAKDLARDLWVGRPRWTRLDGDSPEDRHWPVRGTPGARAYEMTLDDDGWVVDERLFDAAGARITQGGAPFPPIPAGLPDTAFLANGDRVWLSQARSLDSARRRGTYAVWDRNGVLQERQQYDDAGAEKPLRREQYKNGALWSLVEQRGAERVQSFFRRRDGSEPVLRSSTIYRDGDRDREETLYDVDGVRCFSVRLEKVSAGHVRRYDDGQLVFEAIWDGDAPAVPPQKVAYYGEGGALLVDYRSLGDGKGELRLHLGGAPQVLPIDDEADRNEYGHWGRFLPGFAHYEADRTKRDWQVVTERFLAALDERRFAAFLAAQPIPDALAPILARVDWATIRAANDGHAIGKLLVTLLGDDAAAAQRAHGLLWGLIEQQDCVYAATYAVAETLARLLPVVTEEAPRRRVLKNLADIVCLPALAHEDEQCFADVVAATRAVLPDLTAFARTADDADGRAVLHLLAQLGEPEALRARLDDAAASIETRAFAACALGACRGLTEEQRAETVQHLRRVFDGEPDPGVKVVLGLLVRLTGREDAPRDPAIDALLVHYILHPADQDRLFAAWRPVIGFLGDDIPSMLMRAIPPEVRLEHIDAMLDRLPTRGSLDQATDLDILFATLFPEGADQELSPLHRKALRIAADLVDEHPGFVNHGEIFRKHALPWDSFRLRELARAGTE